MEKYTLKLDELMKIADATQKAMGDMTYQPLCNSRGIKTIIDVFNKSYSAKGNYETPYEEFEKTFRQYGKEFYSDESYGKEGIHRILNALEKKGYVDYDLFESVKPKGRLEGLLKELK